MRIVVTLARPLDTGLQSLGALLPFIVAVYVVVLFGLVALPANAWLLYRPPARRSKLVTFALVGSMVVGLLVFAGGFILSPMAFSGYDKNWPFLFLGGVLLLWMTVANLRRSSDSRLRALDSARRGRRRNAQQEGGP